MDVIIQPHTQHRQQYFDSLADFASSEEHLVLLEIRSENSPINNDPDKILDEERRAKLEGWANALAGLHCGRSLQVIQDSYASLGS